MKLKKKSLRRLRSGRITRRRTLLLTRKTKVRKGLVRKPRRGLIRKKVRFGRSKRGLVIRKKRRIRRKVIRRVHVIQPPVHVVPVVEAPPAPQALPSACMTCTHFDISSMISPSSSCFALRISLHCGIWHLLLPNGVRTHPRFFKKKSIISGNEIRIPNAVLWGLLITKAGPERRKPL